MESVNPLSQNAQNIRNFCIIAHIDHGKSTLADRFLEITQTVAKNKLKEQMLDMMDLERERGITIKLQPARMEYTIPQEFRQNFPFEKYILNLIDTPGHVDFNYEVSRSLAAVEGAILLVDATQGVQAQTLGNLYLALEQNLTIIPVINKIDLPNAQIENTKKEIIHLLGCQEEEILLVSAKTGQGVENLLLKIIEKIPPPSYQPKEFTPHEIHKLNPLKILIFDSKYDEYRGIVAFGRVFCGEVKKGDKIFFLAQKKEAEVMEVGYFKPFFTPAEKLCFGEIGYLVTSLKDLNHCRVGDTITKILPEEYFKRLLPLPGYKDIRPMVFASVFPKEGINYEKLRQAVLKLKLNDAALFFEPEHSEALGFGLRCGFLGLLHLEIFKERLKREHGIEIIVTTPSVAYKLKTKNGEEKIIKGALEFPNQALIEKIEEPWVRAEILTPAQYIGKIMQVVQEKRGIYKNTEYFSDKQGEGGRVILHYELPLAAILTDFYDKLKSVSSGYASLNYDFLEYREVKVIRLDILVAEEKVEALSMLVLEEEARQVGRFIVEKLKQTLPRQLFEVKIQAAVGGKIIAAERLPALRKDVTAKLYGGDVTRKMKLLEKQKKGKKALKAKGHVDIPPDAYLAILKR